MNGEVIYKVYDEDDIFLGVIDDVESDLSIPTTINSTGNFIQLTLARNTNSEAFEVGNYLDSDGLPYLDSNDFAYNSIDTAKNKVGPGSIINHNYRVDVVTSIPEDEPYLDSDGNPYLDSADNEYISVGGGSGGVKFTGFISNIAINVGGSEQTVITVTSYGFDLDQYLIHDGADTTVVFNSQDPSDILKSGLDEFVSDGGLVTYDTGSVEDTGTTVSYTFKVNTYKEFVQKCLELSPYDWFYYIDQGENILYFKQRPSAVQHYFYIGKHIEELNLESSILSATNDAVFSGGDDPLNPGENIYVRYTESPAAGTRRVLSKESDNRVTTQDSADILAQGAVERNNTVLYTSTVSILAADYDINTIRVGDLVGFRNADNFIDGVELQVTKTTFMLDKIVLDLGTLLPSVNKRLEDIKRNLDARETMNNPDSPS